MSSNFTAVNAAGKTLRTCAACPTVQDAAAFRDCDGVLHRRCYVCQICDQVLKKRKDLRGLNESTSLQLRSEIKQNGMAMMQSYENAMRKRDPQVVISDLYNRGKLVLRLDKQLDEKEEQGKRRSSIGPSQPYDQKVEGHKPSKLAGASKWGELSIDSDSESVLSDPTTNVLVPREETSAAKVRSQTSGSKTVQNSSRQSNDTDARITKRTGCQTSRHCNRCDELKHWAYFVSPQKRTELAINCIDCRLGDSINSYLEKPGHPVQSAGSKYSFIQEAMKSRFNWSLGQWKKHLTEHGAEYFEAGIELQDMEDHDIDDIFQEVRTNVQQRLGGKWDEANTINLDHGSFSSASKGRSKRKCDESLQQEDEPHRSKTKRGRRSQPDQEPTDSQTGSQLLTLDPVDMPSVHSAEGPSRPPTRAKSTPNFREGQLRIQGTHLARSSMNGNTRSRQVQGRYETPEVNETLQRMFGQFDRAHQLSRDIKSSRFLAKFGSEGSLGDKHLELLQQTTQRLERLIKFYDGLKALEDE